MSSQQLASTQARKKSESADLLAARSLSERQFPRLKSTRNVIVQSGEGPGFAEFFPADEERNPNLGIPTVEIRSTPANRQELSNTISGDLFHQLGIADPQFRTLKQQFVNSLSSNELGFARNRFAEQKQQGVIRADRDFNEWFNNVWADSLIRGFVLDQKDARSGASLRDEISRANPGSVSQLREIDSFLRKE